jgi:hypothetical protein
MKYTLIITLCFVSSAAMAQTGFFLQPVAGIGLTNVSHVDFTSQTHSDDYDLNFDAGVLAGYCHGKWVFTTGLQYLRTGSKVPLTITDPIGNPSGTAYIHYRYSHVVLPLEVGRVFAIGKKLTITPSAGVGLSYNTGAEIKDKIGNRVVDIPVEGLNSYKNGTGCYAIAQAGLAWPVSPQLAITCAPVYNYMLTRMIFQQMSANAVWDHDYSLMLNIGVKWQFAKKTGKKAVGEAK